MFKRVTPHGLASILAAGIFAGGILAGGSLATPASAQTATPAAPAPAAPPASAGTPSAPAGRAHAVVEKRIADLRSQLKITPDQTKAFDEFAGVMRDNANRMDALVATQVKSVQTMTAVDHMKAYEAITQARADDLQRSVPAFSRLYDVLTPAQKKIADDSFRKAAMAAQRG